MNATPKIWNIYRAGVKLLVTVQEADDGTYLWDAGNSWGWGSGYSTPRAAAEGWSATYGYRWDDLQPAQ